MFFKILIELVLWKNAQTKFPRKMVSVMDLKWLKMPAKDLESRQTLEDRPNSSNMQQERTLSHTLYHRAHTPG